jgi:hypothetical protein
MVNQRLFQSLTEIREEARFILNSQPEQITGSLDVEPKADNFLRRVAMMMEFLEEVLEGELLFSLDRKLAMVGHVWDEDEWSDEWREKEWAGCEPGASETAGGQN